MRSSFRAVSTSFVLAVLALFTGALNAQVTTEVKDNLGKEFYIAFGPNTGGETNMPQETQNDVALYITSKVPTAGRVEIPALNIDQTFTSTPGQITTVKLPNGNNNGASVTLTGNDGERIIKGMAVRITSIEEVAVFGMNHKRFSTDAFMALPIDVLGTEYRAMSYPMAQAGQGFAMPSQFWIVGVEDGTNVTIVPKSMTARGKPANTPIDIVLNRGDVYLVQSATNGGEDLTGSLIESDRAIAVFSGHERAAIPFNATLYDGQAPSRDHLVEQLPPVSAWGDSAFVVPHATADRPDLVRIISAEDNNTISINGSAVATLNAGQFYQIDELTSVAQVQATNPILIAQFAPTSMGVRDDPFFPAYGDPAMALVFPVEQFTNTYTIVSVEKGAFTGNFVNIVVEAAGVPSMKIDGIPIPVSEFKPIPGTTYFFAQISVTQGTHNLDGDKPFGVTVYAFGDVDSYSYTGGTLTKTITPLKSSDMVIDFGDRVLDPVMLAGVFDSVVSLVNTSTEEVNIFGFPRRTQDVNNFEVIKPVVPHKILALLQDSMTIRFDPKRVANRRMHTQITAKTDHLRAYVVDVYGRGVIEQNIATADSGLQLPIQEIDFGYFSRTDPPSDSAAYIGNVGFADLDIVEMMITGPNMTDFRQLDILKGANLVTVPFRVDKNPAGGVRVELQFVPGGADGFREAFLDYKTKAGVSGRVRLIANILTIEMPTVQSAGWEETPLCRPGRKTITIHNPNSVPMRVDSILFKGANPDDFMIDKQIPFEIPPRSSIDIPIVFQPEDVGARSAQAYIYFNIPKGLWRVSTLTGSGSKYQLEYHVPKHIHILTNESFRLPIYADVDLAPFQARGYTLHLRYDPTHLEDVDIELENTLSQNASISFDGDYGERILNVTLREGATLRGGGTDDPYPLIVVKFRSFLAEGENRREFQEEIPIHYNLQLKDKQVEDYCITQKVRTGIVFLDSTCIEEVFVQVPWDPPSTPELEYPVPNPFARTTSIGYHVPGEYNVLLEVLDEMGRVVSTLVNQEITPGFYRAAFDAGDLPSGVYTARFTYDGTVRTRRMVLEK